MKKIGIKVSPNVREDYLRQIIPHADYIEIYAETTVSWDYKYVLSLGIPVLAVHVAHFDSGVNFSDSKRNDINLKALNKALEIADYFGCNKVVFHPELLDGTSTSVENLIQFLLQNYDPRLLVENMPFSTDGQEHLCRNYTEIEAVIKMAGVGFCLDFTHACEYARRVGIDEREFLKKLLSLEPQHFHLADTDLSEVFDEEYNEVHLNFGAGDLDMAFVRKNIPDNSEITVETPQITDKQIHEIKYLKS